MKTLNSSESVKINFRSDKISINFKRIFDIFSNLTLIVVVISSAIAGYFYFIEKIYASFRYGDFETAGGLILMTGVLFGLTAILVRVIL